MGLRRRVAELAAGAPVPVFAVTGVDVRDQVQDLRLDPSLRLVASPRQANVLLLAGHLPDALVAAAIVAHDVMPPPRCTVVWAPHGTPEVHAAFDGATVVTSPDPAEAIRDAHRSVLTGTRRSEPPVQPDLDPAPWRGEGPYGQGGTGMTGGVPYGRPMATREDDRDGLTLDVLPVPVGPLFAGFPEGLTARVTFAGDLVHRIEVGPNPYRSAPPQHLDDPFRRALRQPVTVAELEIARARSLLRWTAEALRIAGLDALSVRTLALARGAGPVDAPRVARLRRWVTHAAVTGRQLRGLGEITPARLHGLGVGPVGRASGVTEDLRTGDAAYRQLGFEPISTDRGDAAARWHQRLGEAQQALELAGRAGALRSGGSGAIESPRGRLEEDDSPSARLLALVPELVTGREWGDAVTLLTSLDLDLRGAASTASSAGSPP